MPFYHSDSDQKVSQESLSAPLTPIAKPKAGEKLIYWRIGQGVSFAASIILTDLLLFVPELGLDLLWNILIPLAPAIIVLLPSLWRNICPLATESGSSISHRASMLFLGIATFS